MSTAELSSRILLDWPDDPSYRAVGRLVLGGVAARVDLPVDRVDELGLLLDTLARVPVVEGRLELEIVVGPNLLSIHVGPFASDPLADPAIRRIVAAIADGVDAVGAGGSHRVVLTTMVDPAAAG